MIPSYVDVSYSKKGKLNKKKGHEQFCTIKILNMRIAKRKKEFSLHVSMLQFPCTKQRGQQHLRKHRMDEMAEISSRSSFKYVITKKNVLLDRKERIFFYYMAINIEIDLHRINTVVRAKFRNSLIYVTP